LWVLKWCWWFLGLDLCVLGCLGLIFNEMWNLLFLIGLKGEDGVIKLGIMDVVNFFEVMLWTLIWIELTRVDLFKFFIEKLKFYLKQIFYFIKILTNFTKTFLIFSYFFLLEKFKKLFFHQKTLINLENKYYFITLNVRKNSRLRISVRVLTGNWMKRITS